MNPLVSVVVPSFNNAAHIEATLDSVIAQTFTDFELIISDHSSTDGTPDCVMPFLRDPRVRLVSISAGGGAWRNWNHVTSLACGKYLKLVCADDLLTPNCLQMQVDAFEDADPGVTLVASRRDIIDTNGRAIVRDRGLRNLGGRVAGHKAAREAVRSGTNVFGEPCCVLFLRETLQAAGLWEGSHGYVIDLATYFKVLCVGDLVAIPESLAAFRISAGQWSVELRHEQEWQVHEFRRRVHEDWAEAFTARDRAQGAIATKLHSWQRQLAYKILARRM